MKLKIKKPLPFEFVFDELSGVDYRVKAMFGAHAVYSGDKILFILREKDSHLEDNGIWIATLHEHHPSLRKDFPSMRSIFMFGPGPTTWQNLPVDSDGFEESAMKLCKFIRQGDVRIGKVPASKKKKVKAASRRSKKR